MSFIPSNSAKGGSDLYYHFLSESRRLSHDRTRVRAEIGPLPHIDDPVPCSRGWHGCKLALDALFYARGPILDLRKLSGVVLHDVDKSAASDCEIVAIVDATRVLHEFACWCAEYVLELVGAPDPRSVAAIETKRAWLRGEATDAKLDNARDIAMAAVLAENTRPAKGAAWSTIGATLDNALEAANAASSSAANVIYAANVAGRAPFERPANNAGYLSIRNAQNAKLEEMLSALLGEAEFHEDNSEPDPVA